MLRIGRESISRTRTANQAQAVFNRIEKVALFVAVQSLVSIHCTLR